MAERILDCRNLTAYFYKWWQTTLGAAEDASDSKQRETAIRKANGFRRAYFTARKWLYEHTDVPEANIHALIENKHGGSSIPIAPARRALEALDEQLDNLKLLAFMWEHYPAQCKAIELPRPAGLGAETKDERDQRNENKAPRKNGKRGRKPEYDAATDQEFADAWERKKAYSVPFKDFCKEQRVPLKEGKRILARIRHRKRAQ